MAKQPDEKDFIAEWFQKIGAQHRVKAVCKPCWEIKYCPYGPLVEEFPLGSAVRGKSRHRTVSLDRSMSYGLFCPGTI